MIMYTVTNEKRRPLTALLGLLQSLGGLVLFWSGLCSCLVGLAYSHQKGHWMPFLVGLILLIIGLFLLGKGLVKVIRNVFTRPLPQGDEF